MLRIVRNKVTEGVLEKAHLDGLFDFVSSRLKFSIIVYESLGKNNFSDILAGSCTNIPVVTKTTMLNNLIGDNTSFTQQIEWDLFSIDEIQNKNIVANRKPLLKALKRITSSKLMKILIGKPEELVKVENEILNSLPSHNQIALKFHLSTILEIVFDYDYFAKKGDHYNAFKLIETSGIKSCPYCNKRSIVTNYVKVSSKKFKQGLRSELDHFFPKNDHPMLALSFYNLIPSCLECNLRLKGKIPFNLQRFLHPYLTGFDIQKGILESERVAFKYKFVNKNPTSTSVLNVGEDDIKIFIYVDSRISNDKKSKLFKLKGEIEKRGSINVFQLRQSYNDHESRLKAVTVLSNVQNKINSNYVQSLSWFYNEMADSFIDVFKRELMVFWNENDHTKASYSKLSRDLYVQELKNIGIIIKY